MATTVTIRFSKKDTQPPIYLAGSFSDPAWQPQEMEYNVHDNVYEYRKEVTVEVGKEYQYKFRIGPGNWWMLNEDAPTVTDDIGNRNNLLKVPAKSITTEEGSKEDEVTVTVPSTEANDATMKPQANDPSAETNMLGNTRRDTSKAQNKASPPKVTVEKIDLKPRHGEDFGEDATVAQRDAHAMRAQDAEPDYVMVRNDSDTSGVAAEVADSAATLDKEAPTPPISDEEAGRIGFRRMSSTPIPEVAKTASEVADSAAKLDGDDIPELGTRPDVTADDPIVSGAATPWEERAPLFAYECLEPPTEHGQHEEVPRTSSPEKPEVTEDFDDPSLEEFPHDRQEIMEQFRAMEARLKEDETTFDGLPASPVVGNGSNPMDYHDLPIPSPRLLAGDQSPSLDSIPEEKGAKEKLSPLPVAATLNHARQRSYRRSESSVSEHGTHPRAKPTNSSAEQETGQTTTSAICDDEVGASEEPPAEQEAPNIKIQAASPASSVMAESSEPQDAATTTAVSNNIGAQSHIKSRKHQPSPLNKRQPTPESIHSSGGSGKSKNLLKAFFRTLFIEWIGGFFARLCGSRHRA